ncbi:ABC transporter ATP-binding protein [Kribbella turkmenica]|uniref:ABC transporter ATP-binding protein n=1 Tax=Kribbella turkmenica TaxID=2530375 RepID=A0A4R4XI70_9ACTN|nr:ABC transporter ATP-binding protein [Kribbella turkmenica]TDD30494.1 ABC transporter ATP-binding protein [Kribbella turkmenica]
MTLLSLKALRVVLPVGGSDRQVLRGVDLDIAEGESVGLVGESGSSKSMTARAISRMLPPGARVDGRIEFDGCDVLGLGRKELRTYRAHDVATVFQDPRAALNPVRTIGDFLCEGLRLTMGMPTAMARRRAVDLLAEVGIDDGERRLRQYPHQLSGGLLQRVVIAAALAGEPRLLLADEPTTALDVSTQAEIVAILDRLRRTRGLALLFISHDLDLAASICDRTAVMYAGEIVELQASTELHRAPRHPYTIGLLGARPDIEQALPRLRAIPGQPLAAFEAPPGCAFADRCAHCVAACRADHPRLEQLSTALVRCHRAEALQTHSPGLAKGKVS